MFEILKSRLTENEKSKLISITKVWDVSGSIDIVNSINSIISGLDKEQIALYSDDIYKVMIVKAEFEYQISKSIKGETNEND